MKAINRNIPADIKVIPNARTSLEALNDPKENLNPPELEVGFLDFSPFLRKVLVLGELVAMNIDRVLGLKTEFKG
nr:hypothetical protein [Algoriphagus hitonicola]